MASARVRGTSVWSLAVALAATGGCGQVTGDESAFTSAAPSALRGAPAGRALCRHWAPCQPENPCHVGRVTGCRANVPICTDLGGSLPDGSSCGTDQACREGECVACAQGAPCTPLDTFGWPAACSAGVTSCATGVPVCEYAGPAPDGTQCPDPAQVCKAGACTWCVDGGNCILPDRSSCRQGVLQDCAHGGTCVDSGQPTWNGADCGDGLICHDGSCVGACTWQRPCDVGIPCMGGYTDCSSGETVCVPSTSLPDGTPCPGGVCRSGSCSAATCTPGEPCSPGGNPCATGRRVCDPQGGFCEQTALAPDGTSCGDGLVCTHGACSSCQVSWCPYQIPCQNLTALSCLTGKCESGGVSADGAWCGEAGETCVAGACRGAPGNPLLIRWSGSDRDVAGTAWSACHLDEPLEGMSRRAVDSFGASSLSHADVVFPFSLDCTGPTAPSLGGSSTESAYTEGVREVGWAGGLPAGTVRSIVKATATYLWADDGAGNVRSRKTVFYVDGSSADPAALYAGDEDGPLEVDGYPTLLSSIPRRLLPACAPGGSCQGMGGRCRTWSLGCDYSALACLEAGFAAEGTPCGVAGESCVGGDCVGTGAAALVVRTTSGGSTDLTGTSWATCKADEPALGMSRRKTNVFFAGGATIGEEIYASSTDCSGTPDPARSWQADVTMVPAGDRFVGWRGRVPAGRPATLWGTGLVVSGELPGGGGPFVAKELVVVDASSIPWRLYGGDGEPPTLLDAEGFPAHLLDGASTRQ